MNSKAKPEKRGARATARGQGARVLRIVAGKHRGRRLRFPESGAIRPTPDRVRETLFNWLAPRISGAYCLDAFAGSGALGIEALSRGARAVTFVERDKLSAAAIGAVLVDWAEPGGRVVQGDIGAWLGRGPRPEDRPFDIVFLDPPFDSGLLTPTAQFLERGWMAPDARIYIEQPAREPLPVLPQRWRLLKSERAGEVGYHLFARQAASNEGAL